MELRSFLRIILKGWWIVASFLLITLVVAGLVTFTQSPTYRTSATFIVSPSSAVQDLGEMVGGISTLTRVVATYPEVFSSEKIVGAAVDDLGLSPQEAKALKVSSKVLPSTNVVELQVEGHDPATVRNLAQAIGDEAIDFSKSLYAIYTLKVLDEARYPSRPVLPKKAQNLVLAAVLGLTLGVALTFLVDYLRGPAEVASIVSVYHRETGAYNRQHFLQRVNEEISRVKRGGQPFALALMHIDRLSVVEDAPSARARSDVLRQVTVFLKQQLREEDLVAYMERERFAFLLPDTSPRDARQLMEQLQTRLSWTVFESQETGLKLFLTGTCGLVTVGQDDANRDEVFTKVEEALRVASTNGHEKIHLIDEVSAAA